MVKLNKEEVFKQLIFVFEKYNFECYDKSFNSNSSNLKLFCKKHNHEWNSRVENIIVEKTKCKFCDEDNRKNIAIEKVNKKCDELNYTFLGFKDENTFTTKSILQIKCNNDNHIWFPIFTNFIDKKSNCPKCCNHVLTKERMIENLSISEKETNRIIINKSNLENSNSKLEIICNKCSNKWSTNYQAFLKYKGCKKCLNLSKLDDKTILDKISLKCKSRNYQFLNFKENIYKGLKNKIELICDKNHKFNISCDNFLYSNRGCSVCKESNGELQIRNYLESNNIEYIKEYRLQDCKHIYTLPFDFFIKDKNLMIEYDGKQHSELTYFSKSIEDLDFIKYKDEIKNQYCLNNNIGLIRIRYDENIVEKLNNYFKLS